MSLPRTSVEDVEIDGKVIPKNSVIIPHIYSAHHDKTMWQKPEEFKPERFIDKDRHIIKHKAFYPFSIGKKADITNTKHSIFSLLVRRQLSQIKNILSILNW